MADGRVIVEAILDTANISKNVKGLKSELEGVSWDNIQKGDEKAQNLSNAFKSAGTACTIGLTAPIAAAGVAAFSVAADYDSATSRIQAAFGVTREEAERFKDIGATIYESGWGESLDAVTDALIQTKSTIRDIDDQGLQTVTQNALMLSDVFGADVNESIRGINALMEGFGLSAQEATDLMTAGMQNGLNYTDELGDNLSEYSVRWGEAGMEASTYFSLLEAGASSGAYNLDKVGDFLNEFLTSLSDGRMESAMASFSQSTQDVFSAYESGGATAEDVLNAVIGELSEMTNETDKAKIASELWSSLGEDNALGMITALAGVSDSYTDVEGAATEAGDAASDSFGAKSQEAIRTLQGALEPFGEPLLNIASMVADVATAFGNWLSSLPAPAQQAIFVIAGILAAIGPVLSMIGTIISIIPTLSAVVTAAATAFRALSAAMIANPIGAIITAVMALVTIFITLWNTSEEFRNFWIGLWDAACAAVGSVATWIGANVVTPIATFFTNLGTTVSAIWSAIVSSIQGATTTVSSAISAALNTIQSIWNMTWSSISSFISSVWSGISGTVSSAGNSVRSTISSAFNSILGITKSVWNSIKSAIQSPMTAARDLVKGIINSIKGFFNFSISWPNIPLPHFSISPSGWQVGDLLKGSIPSLSIKWYATGGVFNGASIIGVGEAGPEAVVPLRGRNMQPFAEAISSNMEADTLTAAEIQALRKELPNLFEKYALRTLVVNGREFARLVADTEGLY